MPCRPAQQLTQHNERDVTHRHVQDRQARDRRGEVVLRPERERQLQAATPHDDPRARTLPVAASVRSRWIASPRPGRPGSPPIRSKTASTAQHIGAVESGRTAPSLPFVTRCDDALAGGGTLLALFPSVVQERALDRHARQEQRRGATLPGATPTAPVPAAAPSAVSRAGVPPVRPEAVAHLERVTEPGLAAYLRGFQALASLGDGRPDTALQLLSRLPQDRLPTRTAAWLAATEGRTLAQLGDRPGTEPALSRAHRAARSVRPAEEPAWMYGFDEDRLLGDRGRCGLALGGGADAEAALRSAIARSSGWRRRGELLVDLAAARLRSRDLDESCHLALAALDAATSAGSPLGVERVQRFRTLLPGSRQGGAVAALDERLAAHA